MTAPRISVIGELRVHGREVEIIVKPRWTDADLAAAADLAGFPVRLTIELVPPEPEPLTGTNADINARLRIADDAQATWLAGETGTLIEWTESGRAMVRLDIGDVYAVPRAYIERAPAECPHCGAGRHDR